MTAKHRVATPADWKQGEDVIIAGSVSDDEAKTIYPAGLEGAEAVHPDRAAAEVTAQEVIPGWCASIQTWDLEIPGLVLRPSRNDGLGLAPSNSPRAIRRSTRPPSRTCPRRCRRRRPPSSSA